MSITAGPIGTLPRHHWLDAAGATGSRILSCGLIAHQPVSLTDDRPRAGAQRFPRRTGAGRTRNTGSVAIAFPATKKIAISDDVNTGFR